VEDEGAGPGVVVLAGGGSRRFGADKLAADLGGREVLRRTVDGVISAVPGAVVVVVGPPGRAGALPAGVAVVQEEPAGSGPAAGVLAGARHLAGTPGVGAVAVVPGDAPWAGAAVPRLLAALAGADAAVAEGPDGRRQHLLLAVAAPLLAALDPAALVDAPARALLAGARRVVTVPVDARTALDVDDPAALERARGLLDEPGVGGGRPH